MKKTNPFANLKLDKEEKEIEEAIARDEFVSVGNLKRTKKILKEVAERYDTLQKSKRITIRMKFSTD